MSRIDIDDLNYLYSHEEMIPLIWKNKYNSKLSTLIINLFRVWKRGLHGLVLYLFTKEKKIGFYEYVFLAPTLNNKRALEPIQSKVQNSILLEQDDIEVIKTWRFSLFYFIKVLYKYLMCKDEYLKKVYVSEFIEYCFTYGYSISATKILKKISPKVLVLANDHSALQRSFFRVAQKLGIKTIYIQHASVSVNFPPLEFDYAFLDGIESYKKYIFDGKDCKSTVFLSGSPRFDIIKKKVIQTETKNRLGISINVLDSIDKVINFIQKIKKELNFEVTIRPHPSMDMDQLKKTFQKVDCYFSNSVEEDPFEFINKNDIFISGVSSIHLDVVISDKISLYYNFTDQEVMDGYGYMKEKLIPDISSDPVFYLKEFESGRLQKAEKEICQYYVANYGTKYWGRASELISSSLIMISNNSSEEELWDKKEGLYIIKEEV